MLNVISLVPLNLCNLIRVANIAPFQKFSNTMASLIAFLAPHTHQQNGAIERKHRHIVETGLALLSFASVPRQYWDDAFVTACYLINRMPTPLLKNQSPFELLFKTPPDYKILRIFGCACWPHLWPYNSNKLQPRSLQCVFLGYSLLHKGYKCLHLPTGRVYFSRDVLFQEDIFPFATTPSHSSQPTVNPPPTHPRELLVILPPTAPTHSREAPLLSSLTPRATVQPVSSAVPHTPCVIQPPSPFFAPPHSDTSSSRAAHHPSLSPSNVPSLPTIPDSPSPVAPPPSHTVSPPSAPNLQVSHHPMTTRSKHNISKPTLLPNGQLKYPLPHALFTTTDLDDLEPTCYSTAIKHLI